MSMLNDFLNPLQAEEKSVFISNRFVKRDSNGDPVLNENGKPVLVPFVIRAISQEENEQLLRRSRRPEVVNGQKRMVTDSEAYSRALILAATVEPNFSSKEFCDKFGVIDPSFVPGKMLLTGEYANLMREIISASGLDPVDIEEELKN